MQRIKKMGMDYFFYFVVVVAAVVVASAAFAIVVAAAAAAVVVVIVEDLGTCGTVLFTSCKLLAGGILIQLA